MLDDLKGELAAEEVDSTVPGTTYKPQLTNRRQLSAGERQELLAMVQGTRSRAEAASGVAGHAPSMHGASVSSACSSSPDESLREARISMYLPRLLNRLLATDGVCGLWPISSVGMGRAFSCAWLVAGSGRCLTI
jgi:hypothetical protein